MQHAPAREHGTLIQSVRRASTLLKAFGGASELGVAELGRKLNLHKSTVSRLLATLESEGLVERAPGTEKYRLGYEFARLAGQATHFGDVRAAAQPVLAELAAASQETVNLAVLDGDEVVNVEQAVGGAHLVAIGNWVGRRTPLHCVANGKALLACLPETEVRRRLARPLARFTSHTITSKIALRAELARARAQGYAAAVGEIEEGLNAVAAPVRDAQGEVVAAVSVSGPAFRIPAERLPELGALVARAAEKISARMGHSSSAGVARAGPIT